MQARRSEALAGRFECHGREAEGGSEEGGEGAAEGVANKPNVG
jgi:hypothetical protein